MSRAPDPSPATSRRRSAHLGVALIAATGLVAAACGDDDADPATTEVPGSEDSVEATDGEPISTDGEPISTDGEPATTEPMSTEAGTATTEDETMSTETSASTGKITGTAETVGDVGSASPAPLESGTLTIIPPTVDMAEFWEIIDFVPTESDLPYVSGLLTAEDLEPTELAVIEDGLFAANPTDGESVVCLLDGTGPYVLNGCALVTVDGPATWAVKRGEGGFELTVTG